MVRGRWPGEVLGFVGLQPGDYQERTLSHEQIVATEPVEALPDAVMTVASLPTPVIRHLIRQKGYGLVPLPFAEAFALEDLSGNEATTIETSGVASPGRQGPHPPHRHPGLYLRSQSRLPPGAGPDFRGESPRRGPQTGSSSGR